MPIQILLNVRRDGRCEMKKRIFVSAMILSAVLLSVACGQKKTQETVAQTGAELQSSAETLSGGESVAETTGQTDATGTESGTQQNTGQEQIIRGVVVDLAMNFMTIQTEAGELLTVATGETAKEKPDFTGMKQGLSTGVGVELTGRMETGGFVLKKAVDAETKCEDPNPLAAAGNVLLCVRDRSLKGLGASAVFPLYVGIGEGKEVTGEEELEELFTAEQIFTPELVKAVSEVNLLTLEAADGSMVISKDGGKPNIVISNSDDGWGITGINVE